MITPKPAMNEETEDACALVQQCLDPSVGLCFSPARAASALYIWRPFT